MTKAKRYFAYIRVSTVRQGQTGTSLVEQKSAIERYAERWNLKIIREFEEKETASKRGRPVFLAMLRELKKGRADGVVMHKIDRSARNLRDWAELVDLIDKGVDVHFANEKVDFYSRGGRLSADIQAVVAADYIRNLREEVIKGFYGRLKQGFYPMPAPLGYLDTGAGKPKDIDPVQGPLVKKAFELYSSGRYALRSLTEKMRQLGLRGKRNQTVSINSLNLLLHNPFYTGTIRLRNSGAVYAGQHAPLVSRRLFDQVQDVMKGRRSASSNGTALAESFLFRKLLRCGDCKGRLIGERQKGNRYYRCHTRECPQKTIREELVEKFIELTLKRLSFDPREEVEFRRWFESRKQGNEQNIENERKALKLQLEKTRDRLSRLTDALADGVIDNDLFAQKKNQLTEESNQISEKLVTVETREPEAMRKTAEFLELASSAYLSYKRASFQNKQDLVKTVTSNLFVNEKSVIVKTNLPFELLLNRRSVLDGGAQRDDPRTLSSLLSQVWKFFVENGEPH